MSRIEISQLEKFLLNVQKPARYIGKELNVCIKEACDVRIALSYPDLYEVAMSNNGIQVLYAAANAVEGVACERVCAVAPDMEEALRKNNIPLYTLETYTPLSELDLVGFNVSHELLYSNILQILDLGNIPVKAAERDESHPLVIAGGEAVSNPLPLFDFIDAFFIGDGEEGIVDIVNVLLMAKKEQQTRRQILERLAGIEGVLLSSCYSPGQTSGFEKTVRKRIYAGREMKIPPRPVVSNIRITQERAVVELARGCVNLCKFCHAGYYDLPYRENSYEATTGKVLEILRNTGYNEVTLSSLSISDYKDLGPLLNKLVPVLNEKGITISLPSLKVEQSTLPVIEFLSEIRRTSLTFAVEAASLELRQIANKNLNIDELFEIVDHVFNHGWHVIKLYFMLGLPGCEQFDEAGEIVNLVKGLINHITRKKKEINITLSPFVPKSHTPFQWEKMQDIDYFKNAIYNIKRNLPRFVKVKSHNIYASMLEGVCARGDSRLGNVIYKSYQDGCRFDSWDEYFSFDTWKKNLDELLPSWKEYLAERTTGTLPWGMVQTGREELIAVKRQKLTEPAEQKNKSKFYDLDHVALANSKLEFEKRYTVNKRLRMTLTKTGMMRYVPHLDFMEIMKRAFRMADLPVAFSQGFNKRERLSAGFPVPLGIASEAEVVDVDLYAEIDFNIKGLLSGYLPEGIDVTGMHYIDGKESLMGMVTVIEYRVTTKDSGLLQTMLNNLERKIDFVKNTKNREKPVSYAEVVYSVGPVVDHSFTIKLFAGTPGALRIDAVVLALAEITFDDFYTCEVVKIGQYAGEVLVG